jgi:uncharacterized membrane protein YkoI
MKHMLCAICLAGLLATPPAFAQGWGHSFSPAEARDAVKGGRAIPLSQVFDQLRGRHGGYQLSAELVSTGNGQSEYRIDWMTADGRKLRFVVDAQSGQILDQSGG